MATAHLLFGHVGTGKTTLARRIEAEASAIRFSHDEWMARLFGVDPPVETFAQSHAAVSAIIDGLWPRCLSLGVDVVLDMGFWRRSERDGAREQVARLGCDFRLYEVVCGDEEAWRRVEERNRDLKGSLLIVRETFETLRSRIEPLEPDEDGAQIDTSTT